MMVKWIKKTKATIVPRVRIYISSESSPIKIFYGNKLLSQINPPASFEVIYVNMKIQSTVSDVFYKGNVSPAGCCIGYYCSDGYCEKNQNAT